MKKQDLKGGNVVETRNGERYLIIGEKILKYFLRIDNLQEGDLEGFTTDYIDDNLKRKYNAIKYDIMKVYKDYTCSKLLWERPKELLTQEEKDYVKEILKGVNCKGISIVRGNYFVELKLENDGNIRLARHNHMKFKFEGLQSCRVYALQELGLEG